VTTISADTLLERLDRGDDLVVLDVREPDEFEAWQIPGARNVPLDTLEARLDDLPKEMDVVTVCAVGARAATASELLARHGIASSVLEGGMGGWSVVFDDASVELDGATVVQVRRRGKGCLSYLVGAGGAAAVIDPAADIDQYVTRAAQRGWAITHVFDTHLHADHVSGARALAAATGAALCLNPLDHVAYPHTDLHDGERVAIAATLALTVSVLSTPGHTRGSTVIVLGDAAMFTGDTLFLESVGRPDLADRAEEFAHALFASLHDKLLTRADDTLVLPAHVGQVVEVHGGEVVAAQLGALREQLWQLRADEDRFVEWAVASVSARPPNYATIVSVNQSGRSLDASELEALETGPNRCAIAG
jgi:glyoxylase-like metal-dependent hydrolase (beta-lactamase superfamily II)